MCELRRYERAKIFKADVDNSRIHLNSFTHFSFSPLNHCNRYTIYLFQNRRIVSNTLLNITLRLHGRFAAYVTNR